MNNVYIHEKALVETETIGEGSRIWAFAHVMSGSSIGKDCNIGDHAFIESGVRIGNGVTIKNNVLVWKGVHVADYAFLGPNVVFTNDLRPRSPRMPLMKELALAEEDWLVETHLEEGASIGANSTILAGVTLGRYCLVGAGSVVTKDVPPFALVVGNPARQIGFVDKLGRRVDERPSEPDASST
ncbi:dTDP-3-amino-3,6-dideoxy-alpha-D-galactopyranose 3-N-acetyltransferase [Pontiella desulfatans]|uniref:dTDP-3-amino-3,6-dideoxy-alpha-D-galactopyranose 3-N-acetyltransferase n=1 Tax=Pontiella desulfatans TaxID=2750659 RepID=A0A6C2TX84_PONDE|nr:acyltransferase [Pontiella desulfatans]VGO12162.1 dTDP-3-amino-3,6-dideoxy-alpha-D-galactopyranose 3-N-acetyltransferase [Pontiella desulfatans]